MPPFRRPLFGPSPLPSANNCIFFSTGVKKVDTLIPSTVRATSFELPPSLPLANQLHWREEWRYLSGALALPTSYPGPLLIIYSRSPRQRDPNAPPFLSDLFLIGYLVFHRTVFGSTCGPRCGPILFPASSLSFIGHPPLLVLCPVSFPLDCSFAGRDWKSRSVSPAFLWKASLVSMASPPSLGPSQDLDSLTSFQVPRI